MNFVTIEVNKKTENSHIYSDSKIASFFDHKCDASQKIVKKLSQTM